MLIEKKEIVAAGDVVSFRLTNGEEIVAKLVSTDDKYVVVTKPIIAQIQMVSANQAGLAFGPFMASVNEDTSKFNFPRSNLLSEPLKTRPDIAANYIKMTTGLEVPTGGLLKA